MDLELTDDQAELQSSVRAVLARECPMRLVREVVEKGTAADALWSTMVELGWPALTVPEAHGGLGLGMVETAIVAEELGRVVAPGPFMATATQFVPVLRQAGTPQQQATFLPPVARGERTGALAIDDDTDAPVTATAMPSGGWRLDGVKRHVLDGADTDTLVVIADDAAFVVDVVDAGAVHATPIGSIDASRGMATVRFDGVAVDDEQRLPGDVTGALQEATVALAAETVGVCQSVFDVALEHAKTRVQFGVPIGSFQAVKHKFADMLIAIERARATMLFAALTIAEDDDRRTLATAMAKAAAGDCQRLVAQEGIQTMGGIGYTWEHDMHLYVKRAKVDDALLGNGARHRAEVASLLGL